MTRQLPVSSRPDFVALPSDPHTPLTPEQDAALWGGDVNVLLKMIANGYRASHSFTHEQPLTSVYEENSIPEIIAVPKGVINAS